MPDRAGEAGAETNRTRRAVATVALTAMAVMAAAGGGYAGGARGPSARPRTGTTYSVANGGDDLNSGLAADDPWQTIGTVNGDSFLPGDAVLFRRGDEWYEALTIRSSGTAAEPIVLGAFELRPVDEVFRDGFESGDLSAWSAAVGPMPMRSLLRDSEIGSSW